MLGDGTDAKKLSASMKGAVFQGIWHYISSVILTTYVVLKVGHFWWESVSSLV